MDAYGPVTVVERLPFRRVVVDYISLAVGIEKQARINPADLRQPDRIAPFTFFRVFACHIEIAPVVNERRYHIESLIVGIIGNRRRIYATRHTDAVGERELRRSVEHIAEALPVAQVGTVPYRHSRIERKRRINHIVIIVNPDYRRVGITSGQQWCPVGRSNFVAVGHGHLIAEVGKNSHRFLVALIARNGHNQSDGTW